jgi:hypothetical protein
MRAEGEKTNQGVPSTAGNRKPSLKDQKPVEDELFLQDVHSDPVRNAGLACRPCRGGGKGEQ